MDIQGGDYEERELYKRRLEKQRTAIRNLLEIASKQNRLFTKDMERRLKERQEECERLYRKLDKNEFEIAIVGLEKAGKSTFANALIGHRILPDADERCTYTSTCIRYGSANKATVTFFSQQEFDKQLREKLTEMKFENTEQYSLATLSLGEYKNMFFSLDKKLQEEYETNINEDMIQILENKRDLLELYLGKEKKTFEGEQLKSAEFRDYIIKPEVAIAVKEVLIESTELNEIPNAIIYDVPGFDSPTQMHEDQTLDKMKKADAIVLIASAEKPSLTAPSLKLFNKADEDNVGLNDKLFIFGNRADAANTLEKNIETLREEARKRNLLKGTHLEDRLLVGSAKAHLQALGQEEGDYCVTKLREGECGKILVHGDGIKYAYEKLVEYNQTDRFRVLKTKVNQNNRDVCDIFKQLQEDYGKNAGIMGHELIDLMSAKDKLCDESRARLISGLKDLRIEIRDKYNEDALLSRKMREEISALFESKKYLITEEDIIKAKREVGGVTSSINVEKAEEIIRNQKFEEIYEEFSDTVLKIATKDHRDSYDKIEGLFEEALAVNHNFSSYELVKEKIDAFIQQDKKSMEDADSYQSLIERFVRDLVEVLIMRPYGMEARLNRFLDDSKIFIGLMMFYDPQNSSSDLKRSFMAIAPKDQPLLYALLFHEYKDSMKTAREMADYVGVLSKGIYYTPAMLQLICSMVKKNPFQAFQILKSELSKSDFEKYKDKEAVDEIGRSLRGILNKMPMASKESNAAGLENYDFTNEEEFKVQYQQHFVKKELRKYEDIQKEYELDLEILEDYLVSASIPAISVEKPFIAKEVKAIDKLISRIESDAYSAFIRDNMELFMKGDVDEFSSRQSERMVNEAVVREIENVLRDMEEDS